TEMDAYAKSAVLGLMSWHLYTDAVRRSRDRMPSGRDPRTLMIFEEANKVIAGVSSGDTNREMGSPATTDIYDTMWRDAGKYGFWLALIAQSPAELPPGVVASSNNVWAGRLKNPKDRDLILPIWARSEKGFHDLAYGKHLGRLPVSYFVVTLGLSTDRVMVEPFLVQTMMVPAKTPNNEDIRRVFNVAQLTQPVLA
ncbi:MAG: hypothetical protein KKA73_13600, partial [Chloroflexi bacterium]|nr:hypothetical protein [Chloroflexota bacterium]